MVTGLTEEAVRYCTINIHIPVLQGTFDGYTSVPRSSVVLASFSDCRSYRSYPSCHQC